MFGHIEKLHQGAYRLININKIISYDFEEVYNYLGLTGYDEFKIKLQKLHISNMEYGILLRKTSQEILKKLSNDLRGGRDPYALACATVAGADLLIANNFGKKRGFATQRLISRVGDVAEYTLREHFLQIIKKVIH